MSAPGDGDAAAPRGGHVPAPSDGEWPATLVEHGVLRRAALAALATRVELRDADDNLGDAIDELLDLVVARGADPDAAASAGEWGGAGEGGAGAGAAASPASRGRDEREHAAASDRPPPRPPEPPACTLEDRRALAEQLRATPEDLDGWRLAGELSAGALSHTGERAYLCAQQLAAGAVLQRAARLVGPLRAATRTVREPMLEPWGGELDAEATVDNLLGKWQPQSGSGLGGLTVEPGDLIVQRRVDRRHQVVLMVDTSLSMAGEKMALAAVAAAVLSLKLRPGDLAVVAFADGARVVSRFGEKVPPAELVRRLLAVPCGGGTDIAAALRLGHAELQRGRDPGRSGLLVSDGVFTCGADPLPAAARFGRLHVLLMEKQPLARDGGGTAHDGGRGAGCDNGRADGRSAGRAAAPVTTWISPRFAVGEAIARAADGALVHVDGFAALPRRMLEVADRVLR